MNADDAPDIDAPNISQENPDTPVADLDVDQRSVRYIRNRIESHHKGSRTPPKYYMDSLYKELVGLRLSQEGYEVYPYLVSAHVMTSDNGQPILSVKWLDAEMNLPPLALYDVEGNQIAKWEMDKLPWADDSPDYASKTRKRQVLIPLYDEEPNFVVNGKPGERAEAVVKPGELAIELNVELDQLAGVVMFGLDKDERPQYVPIARPDKVAKSEE